MKFLITGVDYRGQECVLLYKNRKTVLIGDLVTQVGDKVSAVSGGVAPQQPGSVGRVLIKLFAESFDTGVLVEFYPSAINAEWVSFEDLIKRKISNAEIK